MTHNTFNDYNIITDDGSGHFKIEHVPSGNTFTFEDDGTLRGEGPVEAPAVSTETDPITSITWFGAVGDGTTDNTSEIQSAVDAVSGPNTVYIPPGDYIISDFIDIPSDTTIAGPGTLRMDSSVDAGTGMLYVGGRSNVTVRGVTLDGNQSNRSGTPSYGSGYGIRFASGSSNCWVSNCRITNTPKHGVLSTDSNHVSVTESYFTGTEIAAEMASGSDFRVFNNRAVDIRGVGVVGTCAEAVIAHNHLESNANDQAMITIGEGANHNRQVVVGNVIKNAARGGIEAASVNSSGGVMAIISNNQIYSPDDQGIVISGGGPDYARVAFNMIRSSGKNGILATSCSDITVKSNTIVNAGTNTGATNADRAGIRVSGYSSNTRVKDNDVWNSNTDGILVGSPDPSSIEVIGNRVKNASGTAFNVATSVCRTVFGNDPYHPLDAVATFASGGSQTFTVPGASLGDAVIAQAMPANDPGNDHGYEVTGTRWDDSAGSVVVSVTETASSGGGDAHVVADFKP